ncbi:MAG: hypothetical protein AAF394_00130 [Planctomycetota bacterium]
MSDPEIREYVASLKTRSPEEVMGDAATSKLSGSMLQSSAGWLGGLCVLTIVVFVLGGGPKPKAESATANPATPAAEEQPLASDSGDGGTSEEATPQSNTEKAIDAMGIGETKDPDAKPDNIENRLDKLLDGLD